nr:response regulator [uncultured Bacillus sp.]
MNFFIVDDSRAIRAMLTEIILSEGLGKIVGEAEDGKEVTCELLYQKGVDILLIDLLMKKRDGLETIREIRPYFKGKVILISQVDQKEMVAEAYLLGTNHYITKPINKYEVVSVIQNETKHYLQEKSIANIQQSLISLTNFQPEGVIKSTIDLQPHSKSVDKDPPKVHASGIVQSGDNILMELGLVGESGYYDLLSIIEYLFKLENSNHTPFQIPSLKQLFNQVALANCKSIKNDPNYIKKEAKASEQRVRRAIQHALNNFASLGLTDFSNPIFDNYASKFFDFTQVRMKMMEMDGKKTNLTSCRLNVKKFIEVLYIEAKKSMLKNE